MSNPGQPVGQIAYQGVVVACYGAALRAYASASNRYGGGSNAWNSHQLAGYAPPGPVPVRRGRFTRFAPWAGQAPGVVNGISAAGGGGYAVNDLVTFVSLTHNRPIVVQVTAVAAGIPTGIAVVDQGGGVPAGSNGINGTGGFVPFALTQASTTGAGAGAVWTCQTGSFGWQFMGNPNPLSA